MTLTPFEAASRTAITTLATETTWINALVAANPTKVTKQVLGQSAQGRDLYVLAFGSGTGAPLLCLNSVHGDEVLPREAAMTLARDLCETAHPWATLLAERKLWLVVTGNPDGHAASTRLNGNGQDINRHYVDYAATAPEARRYADLVHSLMPAAVYDGHEWNGSPADCYVGMGNFAVADAEVRQAMISTGDYVSGRLTTWGALSCPWYPRDSPENSVQHLTSLLGIPFLLMETAEVNYGNPLLYGQRHDRHRVALGAWLDWMQIHATDYAALGVAARQRMAGKVAKGDTFWPIYQQAPVPAASWSGGDTGSYCVTAAGYTASNLAGVSAVLDAHGIPYGGGGTVSLDNYRAALAAFILDPTGLNLGAATRTAPGTVHADPPVSIDPAHQLWPTTP